MLKLLVLLLSTFVWAKSATETVTYTLEKGRKLTVEIAKASDGKPTFLFLPGMNRGLLLDESAAQKLIEDGYGVVSFNFSVQPLSVAALQKGEKPAFYSKDFTLNDFAFEVTSLTKSLREKYKIQNVIPVSLSYSGAVSRVLGAAEMIDTVPFTSMEAFQPGFNRGRDFLRWQELMNPFLFNARKTLDAQYAKHWTTQVKNMMEQFSLPKERAQEMVDGYIRLSRSTENFDFSDGDDKTQRLFILAGSESPSLQEDQIATIAKRRRSGKGEPVVVVLESGHIIPADQPKIYAEILEKVVAHTIQPGLTVVTPSANTWQNYPPEVIEGKLREILELNKKAVEEAIEKAKAEEKAEKNPGGKPKITGL